MCAIQNRSKLCHTNFATFDAKKSKETLRKRLSGNTTTLNENLARWEKCALWKTTLNPRTLACFENSPKCPPSCPSFLHPKVVSSIQKQVDVLWHSLAKESTYLGYIGCQSGRNEEERITARSWGIWRIYRLIYWREILCHSCEFFP